MECDESTASYWCGRDEKKLGEWLLTKRARAERDEDAQASDRYSSFDRTNMTMPQQQEEEELQLSASHSGRVEFFSLARGSATVLSLQQRLEDLFDVPAAAQKVLLTKGRKLAFHSPDELLVTLLPPSTPGVTKLLLIGPTSASFSALQASHAEREAKHQAFQHHRLHRHAPVRNTTNAQESAELRRWKFGELKPFGAEVECQEERRRMLERLSEDRAVRDVMRRHR